jgi:hypothetical protein
LSAYQAAFSTLWKRIKNSTIFIVFEKSGQLTDNAYIPAMSLSLAFIGSKFLFAFGIQQEERLSVYDYS